MQRRRKRWKMARRGWRRLVVAVVVLAAAFIALLGGLHGGLRAEGAACDSKATWYVVCPGDTLWDIAVRLGGRTADPRRLAWEIQRENQLSSPVIRPGQLLQIPPY